MNSTTFCAVLAALVMPVGACGTPVENSRGPESTTIPTTGPTSASEPGRSSASIPPPSSASRAACPTGWSSLPKTSKRASAGSLTDIRSGKHACFDRMVFRLSGAPGGYDVRYVDVVREDGSGNPVPLRGGARLAVVIRNPAYDVDTGRPTYLPANKRDVVDVSGYHTFRQVAWAGSFEGQTTIGVGVRAKLPFRVFTLTNPTRLILDTTHTW